MIRVMLAFSFLIISPCFAVSLDVLAKRAISQKNTSSIQWQGQRVWIKGMDPERNTFQYCFMRKVFYRMMPFEILNLAPLCGEEVLEHEIARLKEFKEHDVPVPSIVGSGKGWVAITHEGKCLHKHTKKQSNEQQQELIKRALAALIKLHQKNLAHGRALMRDMLYNLDTHEVSFIDLSEYTPNLMPLKKAQARDFLVFILSIINYKGVDDVFLESIFNQYWDSASAPLREELLKVNTLFSTYAFVIDPYCAYAETKVTPAFQKTVPKSNLLVRSHRVCKVTKRFSKWIKARTDN